MIMLPKHEKRRDLEITHSVLLGKTSAELGERYNISPSRICQIARKCCKSIDWDTNRTPRGAVFYDSNYYKFEALRERLEDYLPAIEKQLYGEKC